MPSIRCAASGGVVSEDLGSPGVIAALLSSPILGTDWEKQQENHHLALWGPFLFRVTYCLFRATAKYFCCQALSDVQLDFTPDFCDAAVSEVKGLIKKIQFKNFSLPGLNGSYTMHSTRMISTHTPLFNVAAIICLKKINVHI